MPNADSNPSSNSPTLNSKPWWKGAVLYQIYPRSFNDTNGDGIGDLPGIIERLDYVANLGVDGIWISPFFKSPMKDFGYDVADFRDVDPIFGTIHDFENLIEKAHGFGLKLIIDQVVAHTSDLHDWFAKSRTSSDGDKADWYVWHDPKPDGSPPNNWQSVFGGPAWTWDARRGQYYMHNFLSSQPQLNMHNTDVQDAMLDVIRFWLDKGVDGFRFDAVNFAMHDPKFRNNPARARDGQAISRPFDLQHHIYNQSHCDIPLFLERVRTVLEEYRIMGKDKFVVAEIGGPSSLREMKAFTEGDKRLHSAYSFDFLYADSLTVETVKDSLESWSDRDEGWPSWAFSNHDAPRFVSRWHDGSDPKAYTKMVCALLLCLKGNPIIFQGEELSLDQVEIPFEQLQDPEAKANWPETLGRDGARTPIPWQKNAVNAGFSSGRPWLPIGKNHSELAVDQQIEDESSPWRFVQKILKIRKKTRVLQEGYLSFVNLSPNALGFERFIGGSNPDRVCCYFNFSETQIPIINYCGVKKIVFSTWKAQGTSLDVLPPYGAIVFRPD